MIYAGRGTVLKADGLERVWDRYLLLPPVLEYMVGLVPTPVWKTGDWRKLVGVRFLYAPPVLQV